jgi:hypothetical protein
MSRRHVNMIVLGALVVVTLVALGAATLVSRAAAPESRLSPEQLAALESAPRVSAAEAATIRAPRHGRPSEPSPGGAITAHARKVVDGETWKIVSYRSTSGALCAGVTWPGEGQEMGCFTEDEWFARGPVSAGVGARQAHGDLLSWHDVVVSGLVDLGRVRMVELVSTDCSKREVPLDSDGFFLDVTSPGQIARGLWPYRLLGENADGGVVQTVDVEPEPPPTAEARAAGVRAPAAGPACA